MGQDSIGDRMKKNYEIRCRIELTRRVPVIIRVDGRAFHTLTRNCIKPFDMSFQVTMQRVAIKLCEQIQGAKCAYVQSDEISILITDFDRLTTEAWFDYNLQKIVSISSSIASSNFSLCWGQAVAFDSRAFNIPKEEVCNYFIWRQQDWMKNSVQMLARTYYSTKQLHKKKIADMHEMLYEKNINWNDLKNIWKNGTFIYLLENEGWQLKFDSIFTKERSIVEKYLEPTES